MAKKDEIILIIAKSLSSQKLTPKEIKLGMETDFLDGHGLNDYQVKEIKNWIKLENKRCNLENCFDEDEEE